jgi:hypothetical protein
MTYPFTQNIETIYRFDRPSTAQKFNELMSEALQYGKDVEGFPPGVNVTIEYWTISGVRICMTGVERLVPDAINLLMRTPGKVRNEMIVTILSEESERLQRIN